MRENSGVEGQIFEARMVESGEWGYWEKDSKPLSPPAKKSGGAL